MYGELCADIQYHGRATLQQEEMVMSQYGSSKLIVLEYFGAVEMEDVEYKRVR